MALILQLTIPALRPWASLDQTSLEPTCKNLSLFFNLKLFIWRNSIFNIFCTRATFGHFGCVFEDFCPGLVKGARVVKIWISSSLDWSAAKAICMYGRTCRQKFFGLETCDASIIVDYIVQSVDGARCRDVRWVFQLISQYPPDHSDIQLLIEGRLWKIREIRLAWTLYLSFRL